MIKVIAFDAVGVVLREKDIELSITERVLEAKFGYYNSDDSYYDWATKKTKMNREELETIVENILMNLYEYNGNELRRDFPGKKLFLVSNHLTALRKYLHFNAIDRDFDDILISAEIDAEKPDIEFFDLLLEAAQCSPEEILLVDNEPSNILAAKRLGMATLYLQEGDYAQMVSQIRERLS